MVFGSSLTVGVLRAVDRRRVPYELHGRAAGDDGRELVTVVVLVVVGLGVRQAVSDHLRVERVIVLVRKRNGLRAFRLGRGLVCGRCWRPNRCLSWSLTNRCGGKAHGSSVARPASSPSMTTSNRYWSKSLTMPISRPRGASNRQYSITSGVLPRAWRSASSIRKSHTRSRDKSTPASHCALHVLGKNQPITNGPVPPSRNGFSADLTWIV